MKRDRVVVVGAGLSGLTVAHRLCERVRGLRRPIDLTVLESKGQPGGVISSEHSQGFTLEGGPDSFTTHKPWGIELCSRLGLTEQLLQTDGSHRRSFVVRKGRLAPVPEGFVLMAPHRLTPVLTTPVLSWRGKIRMLMDLAIPRRVDDADESLASFVRRRLGREALDRLVQPLVGAIYTGDPNDLSLKATLPQFLAMEREHGSLIRAAWHQNASTRGHSHQPGASGARYGMFVTLAEGMETLPRAIVSTLPPGAIRNNVHVRRISPNHPVSPWLLELLDGPPIEAEAVIVTTEAHATARMLDSTDPALALQLRAIPYASSTIVNVAYRRDQISHPLDGVGVVVPAMENRPLLAISFLSVKFPSRAPVGTVLFRVFIGGATRPDLIDLDDFAIQQLVQRELGQLLGVSGDPLLIRIGRHPRAMPQYTLGHCERVQVIRRKLSKHPRLFLTGIAYDGAGIPDSIRAAEAAADATLESLANPAAIAAA